MLAARAPGAPAEEVVEAVAARSQPRAEGKGAIRDREICEDGWRPKEIPISNLLLGSRNHKSDFIHQNYVITA